ncbi:hypothetical protein SO802_031247 [Lithocarpus litseifolius]|uniref:Reverse transcriptase zinc-binding domain-containing protein n=1 Tax=Lithocarpus litseifolius TaxID=425828 RepID=A0AAW2BJP0_9ROSI
MQWASGGEVTKPKEMGGFGLQSAKGRNSALLAKLNWRFHIEKEAQWAKVLRFMYYTRQRVNSRSESKHSSSPIWKGLKKSEAIFKERIKCVPGHESNLNFWADYWSNRGPIRSRIQGPLPLDSVNLTIKDLTAPYGWNWSKLPFELPTEIKANIQAVPVSTMARSNDKLAWKFSTKGELDLKSAYLLASNLMEVEPFPGSWIWKLQTLPGIQMFFWKCKHNSIKVKNYLVNQGIPTNASCPLYVMIKLNPSPMLFEIAK